MRFGFLELALIGGLFLIIFGPKRIGQVGDSFKKSVQEYRSSLTEDRALSVGDSDIKDE